SKSSLLPPDAATRAAGLRLGIAQPLGSVRGGPAGAVQHDGLAEIILAELAAILRRAALDWLAGDLPASDITREITHRRTGLAFNTAQLHGRAVEEERAGIDHLRHAPQQLR